MLLEPRQEQILIAVVKEYIRTAEPVASQMLAVKYGIDCSPATIRSELARLEEMGYLQKPHTSAGRVPLYLAYRYFVDYLLRKGVAPPEGTDALVDRVFVDQTEVDRLLESVGNLLARVTRLTSLVLAPHLRRSMFRYVSLVPISPTSILLLLLTNTGALTNKLIELSRPIDAEELERITHILNDRLKGTFLGRISYDLLQGIPGDTPREFLDLIIRAASEIPGKEQRRVVLGGKMHLFEHPEFRDLERLRVLLELLEEENVVAEILEKTLRTPGVQVFIGRENEPAEMRDCAMVTATYFVQGEPLGSLGLIGPMRIPYEQVIYLVGYTAQRFGERLGELTGI